MARDAAYEALLERLGTALPGVTFTRRAQDFSQLSLETPQGLLLMTEQVQTGDPQMPTVWLLKARVEIWRTNQPDDVIDTILNDWLDTVERALDLQSDEIAMQAQTTLGGATWAAWIDGPVTFADSSAVQQSAVIIPITMRVVS